jgi:hypothetical protein
MWRFAIGLLILAAVIVGLSIVSRFWSGPPEPARQELPWQIEVTDAGQSRVFGLVLGESSLLEARRRFDAPARIGLIEEPGGSLSLEAYFGTVRLAGLKAKVVAVAQADREALAPLKSEAVTNRPLPSGARRFELPDPVLRRIQEWPVLALTYVPVARYPEDLVRQRFGPPAEIIDAASGRRHWLYPTQGFAITLDPEAEEILHYIAPDRFPRLRDRLATPSGSEARES